MNASQFDGNAAFSGGGFMPSQATQTADTSFSPAKNRDTQALLSLTVKQINEAVQTNDEKSNFFIDGVDVNTVTLVGMIFNKAERVTDVAFVLDDGTGRVDCNKWINEPVDTKEVEGIVDGLYVRVHGHLKGFQGKKILNAFSIRPVTDFDEIPNHFIECIYLHIYNTKLRKLQGGVPTQPQMTNPTISTPVRGYQAPPPNQFSGQYNHDRLKGGIDQKIIEYLQQPSCLAQEKGVHRHELAQQLNISVDKIMSLEYIRSLEEEGLIYSTIDDCHYKSTGNG